MAGLRTTRDASGLQDFDRAMRDRGWFMVERAVSADLVGRMAGELEAACRTCRHYQKKNGVADATVYTAHHLIGQGDSFLTFLDRLPVDHLIERFFGGKYILNSFGGAINSAGARSYAQEIHRDIRSFCGDLPLLLNTLVMLDDFTPDNGATWLMSGSHRRAERPTAAEFSAAAEQAVGAKGSILLFNSNLWHRGGNNTTDQPRRSVTPMFSRPFFKPQFDYCRALGYERVGRLAGNLQQLLGYFSRVPASLDEWYQPPSRRAYRPDQG